MSWMCLLSSHNVCSKHKRSLEHDFSAAIEFRPHRDVLDLPTLQH